ncbi:hypothetical protein Tco_0813322 [Tanacetum coccineum]
MNAMSEMLDLQHHMKIHQMTMDTIYYGNLGRRKSYSEAWKEKKLREEEERRKKKSNGEPEETLPLRQPRWSEEPEETLPPCVEVYKKKEAVAAEATATSTITS